MLSAIVVGTCMAIHVEVYALPPQKAATADWVAVCPTRVIVPAPPKWLPVIIIAPSVSVLGQAASPVLYSLPYAPEGKPALSQLVIVVILGKTVNDFVLLAPPPSRVTLTVPVSVAADGMTMPEMTVADHVSPVVTFDPFTVAMPPAPCAAPK